MESLAARREAMIAHQLVARGVRDAAVLGAMRRVPREAFVPRQLVELAYDDAPLPIEEGQTISQPYIVARMSEALELSPGDRVLDVGTGSGYGAAVLGQLAAEVYTIERHGSLARRAEERFRRLGYRNIHVRHGDGTLGWGEHAPYDAIVVGAGGPDVPAPLKRQLAVGGRLVVPAGERLRKQRLVRIRRVSEDGYEQEDLGAVAFVPLVGAAGWEDEAAQRAATGARTTPAMRLAKAAEPFTDVATAALDGLLHRIGEARVVCIGEASHGTAEFYEMRARITQALVEAHGFTIVAAEADWPDAAHLDRYVRHLAPAADAEPPFTRFPSWMWANVQVRDFVAWLRAHNASVAAEARVGFYGLDLYSLHRSIGAVLRYLDDVDPEAAHVARQRYGCLSPWEQDPAGYGAATLTGRYRECENDVVRMLQDLLDRQMTYARGGGERFVDAIQNARLVVGAERYYRSMYYGARASWNLRDRHMFDTLRMLLDYRGPGAKAVVWAHNSHLGDASATEMGQRGEHNVGQLCREAFGDAAYLIGFGTDHGTVAAAHDWDGPVEVMQVRPAHAGSYEHLCHASGVCAFLLPLREPLREDVRAELCAERLERAIGVIYRPETELDSHYFYASLPRQFDEYVWIDETCAVTPLGPEHRAGLPETFPFGV